MTAEARVLGSGPGQARPGRATLPVGGGWQAPGARLEEEDGERKRQSEGPSVPGRGNSTAKGPELRESKGLGCGEQLGLAVAGTQESGDWRGSSR